MNKKITAKEGFVMKGVPCVLLEYGKYSAVISPEYGSSVWRMRDEEAGIEVFRYSDKCSAAQIDKAREIWGLPTLYLPNRFDGGLLKTSDGEYHLPVNEVKLGNHLHGWVHKRAHKIEKVAAENKSLRHMLKRYTQNICKRHIPFPDSAGPRIFGTDSSRGRRRRRSPARQKKLRIPDAALPHLQSLRYGRVGAVLGIQLFRLASGRRICRISRSANMELSAFCRHAFLRGSRALRACRGIAARSEHLAGG